MRRLITRKRAPGILVAALLLALGCSQERSFTPEGGLGTDGRFVADTLRATTTAWATAEKSVDGEHISERLTLCHWKNFTSRVFLAFRELPETTLSVLDARLYLYATRVSGEAGGLVGIHALTDSLDEENLAWTSAPGFEPTPVAQFSPPTPAADSVFVDLTDLVSDWITGEKQNRGVMLKIENEEGGPEVLYEFTSSESRPRSVTTDTDTLVYDFRPVLRITYLDTAEVETLAVALPTEDSFADTLIGAIPVDEGTMVAGNGYPSRAFIKFELDHISKSASLARAILRLTPDLGSSSFDSLGVASYAVLDPEWSGVDTEIGASGVGSTVLKRPELAEGETVDLDVTPLITPLIAGRERNYGLVIRTLNEYWDLDYIGFYGAEAEDSTRAPRLELYYLTPAEPPYGEVDGP
jgi:hypothetical protein